jgi:hypothetical protein
LSRSCTVCSHPDSVLINEELVLKRTANRRVAAQYGLTEQSIRRHREHIPEMLARSSLAEEVAEADSLLKRLEDLHRRTEAILARVEETDNYGASLGAIREMRRNLELIGEVTKELDRTPTINLHLNPQWLELRAVIVTALEPYPDARGAVLRAIEEASNGSA